VIPPGLKFSKTNSHTKCWKVPQTFRYYSLHFFLPPQISAGQQAYRFAGMLQHNYHFYALMSFQRLINQGFERDVIRPRNAPSAVTMQVASASSSRSAMDRAENPPEAVKDSASN
jgi:hypothetical protein